jgi:hypothetical protein
MNDLNEYFLRKELDFLIGFSITFILGCFLLSAYAEAKFLFLNFPIVLSAFISAFVGGVAGKFLGKFWKKGTRTPIFLTLTTLLITSLILYIIAFIPGEIGDILKIFAISPGYILYPIHLILRLILSTKTYSWVALALSVLFSEFFWTFLGFGAGYLITKLRRG